MKPQELNQLTVAFCLPLGSLCHSEFAMAFGALMAVTPVRKVIVRGKASRSAAASRNVCMEKLETLEAGALGRRVDWTFWIDGDMSFPPESLALLLSHGKDIVGASYLRRGEPYDLLGEPDGPMVQGRGLSRFKSLPAGLLLVRRAVFDSLVRPWWKVHEAAKAADCTGEDVFFSREARSNSWEIWCDLDLTRRVIHWDDRPLQAEGDPSSLVLTQPEPIVRATVR